MWCPDKAEGWGGRVMWYTDILLSLHTSPDCVYSYGMCLCDLDFEVKVEVRSFTEKPHIGKKWRVSQRSFWVEELMHRLPLGNIVLYNYAPNEGVLLLLSPSTNYHTTIYCHFTGLLRSCVFRMRERLFHIATLCVHKCIEFVSLCMCVLTRCKWCSVFCDLFRQWQWWLKWWL